MRRKTDEQIKEELRAIYAGKDGQIPDLTRLERRGGSGLTRVLVRLIFVLGVLSVVAWGGFFIWSRGGIANVSRPLTTDVDAPETVRSGEESFFTFRYENDGNAPIASLEAKLSFPPDFFVTSLNPAPTNAETLVWTLGSLSRGSDGAITVGGVFRSEVPSEESLQAMFTYRPGNFSSDFQDIATAKAKVNDSVLDATITGPEKAMPGDEVSYVINVQNSGVREATGVLVAAVLPDGFSVTGTEPAADEPGTEAWTVASLVPGELKAVTIKGRYTATVEGEQMMGTRVSFLNDQKTEFLQTEAEVKTNVLGGTIAFGLVINGSTSEQTVDPGDMLRISVNYGNDGTDTAENFVLTLALSGDAAQMPIDWTNAELGNAARSGNTLTWDRSVVPTFASFAPDTVGVIDLSLPLVSSPNASTASTAITFLLSASMDQIGSLEGARSIDASPIVVRVNSDLRSSAHAEYFTPDGEAVGTGPLPPEAGKTTSYRIVWHVANSFHPLENVRMTTNLPPKVTWTNRTAAAIGTVSFDETTRIVTWIIPSLPLSVPGSEATFDVAITPGDDDVGSFYKLTNAIAVEATDTITKDQLADGIDILTTELPEDTEAAGKGVVGE